MKRAWTPVRGVVLAVERDRLVDQRANAVTDITAQAEVVQAGLVADQHRHAHARLVDVGQVLVEGTARAGRHAGNVLAHLARHLAGDEVGRADRHGLTQFGEPKGVIGTVPDAEAAAQAGAEEIAAGQGARRAQCLGRQRGPVLGQEAEEQAGRPSAAGRARDVAEEATSSGVLRVGRVAGRCGGHGFDPVRGGPADQARRTRHAHFLKSVSLEIGQVASRVSLLTSWPASNQGM